MVRCRFNAAQLNSQLRQRAHARYDARYDEVDFSRASGECVGEDRLLNIPTGSGETTDQSHDSINYDSRIRGS